MPHDLNKPVAASYQKTADFQNRRNKMPYRVETTSTKNRGMTRIFGVDAYPAEPDIYFTREAWVKQCHLVDKCNKEVGWFAMVEYDADENVFTITEIVIPEQTVTASETDIGKEAMADVALELIAQNKDVSKLYAWFHSHVNMSVSPSNQDEYQVEDFLADLADQPDVPAFIRGIQNKKGELKLDVYYIQHGIAYQNVDHYVIEEDDPAWTEEIDALIKTRVKERVYAPVTYDYGNKKNAGTGVGSYHSKQYNRWRDDDDLYDTTPRTAVNSFNDYWGGYTDDDAPKASNFLTPVGYDEEKPFLFMDPVFQSIDGADVIQDSDGTLYVVDIDGAVYAYNDFVAAFGDTAFASCR